MGETCQNTEKSIEAKFEDLKTNGIQLPQGLSSALCQCSASGFLWTRE